MRRWDDACASYGSALELDPKNKLLNAKLHANRAAALIKAGKAGEAMEDCNACVALDDKYVKGYLRRAQVRALRACGTRGGRSHRPRCEPTCAPAVVVARARLR